MPLLLDWCTEPKPLHIVYPPNRHLSNKVRVFVDWLAELFARDELIQRLPVSHRQPVRGDRRLNSVDYRAGS